MMLQMLFSSGTLLETLNPVFFKVSEQISVPSFLILFSGINFMTGPCYTDELGRIKCINVQQKTLLAKWPTESPSLNFSLF